MLITMLLAAAIYRYRVAMFVRFNIRLFDVDECQGEDMIYDVFLACAQQDREVGRKILYWLEHGKPVEDGVTQRGNAGGYKVCHHERDFPLGALILEKIQSAIDHSKRVVCLLTQNFMRDEYCMLEFRAAWDQNHKLKKRRLVVIKWPDVDVSCPAHPQQQQQQQRVVGEIQHLDRAPLLEAEQNEEDQDVDIDGRAATAGDVRLFLSTHPYIEYDRDDWWHQLMYALPINHLNAPDCESFMIE